MNLLLKKIWPFVMASTTLMTSACNEDLKPANLVLTVDISEDGSGLVTVTAFAENASYYEFYFDDAKDLRLVKNTSGVSTYVFVSSGDHTIRVVAFSDVDNFIEDMKIITISIFVNSPTTGYSTPQTYSGMNLIWADEFSGSTLNTTWKFDLGDGCPNVCGWGNNELEYYTNTNISLTEGYLVIEARKESMGGKTYTSSRILTKQTMSFLYGRVDVRAALPKGQGIWPAIWMLGEKIDVVGWPACGEIDIMEMIGGNGREKTVYGTPHWQSATGYATYGGNYSLTQGILGDQFHVFSIIWNSKKMTWFIDDIKYHELDLTPADLSEFHEKFFLILNVAVGGNWPGSPDGTTVFPQRMIVDYVRVFQNQ